MVDKQERSPGEPGFEAGISRRQLLQGAAGAGGLLVAGGALAACGGSTVVVVVLRFRGRSRAATADVQSVTNVQASSATVASKSGGNFRLGVTGGGAKDIIDGQHIVTKPDQARLVAGFEGLLVLRRELRAAAEPRDGGHAGRARPVHDRAPRRRRVPQRQVADAEDVIYSLQRIIDPKLGLFGAAGLASLDPKGMTKLDAKTVRLKLKQADATIRDQFGTYTNGIVPVGYSPDRPSRSARARSRCRASSPASSACT